MSKPISSFPINPAFLNGFLSQKVKLFKSHFRKIPKYRSEEGILKEIILKEIILKEIILKETLYSLKIKMSNVNFVSKIKNKIN